MKRLSGFKLILISVFFALIISEIILRLFFPIADPYASLKSGVHINQFIRSSFEPNTKLVTRVDEELPGIHGEHHFTTDNLGFRGDDLVMPKPDNEYRIFLVGGSAMECFYLDDSESVERRMQKQLSLLGEDSEKIIKVYNAGKSGLRSDDHVALISQRLVHLQPDMIIVMCGLNDLRAAMHNFDYLHYDEYAYKEGIGFWRQLRMLSTEFQIGRRLQNIFIHLSADKQAEIEALKLNSDYHEKIELQKKGKNSIESEVPKINLEAYQDDLQSIVGICSTNHINLVFCTQQSTWNSKVDPKCKDYSWMRYMPKQDITIDEFMMDSTMNLYNNVMAEVCKDDSVPFVDIATELPKSTEYFYDDCHFNSDGSQKFAEIFSSHIYELGITKVTNANQHPIWYYTFKFSKELKPESLR